MPTAHTAIGVSRREPVTDGQLLCSYYSYNCRLDAALASVPLDRPDQYRRNNTSCTFIRVLLLFSDPGTWRLSNVTFMRLARATLLVTIEHSTEKFLLLLWQASKPRLIGWPKFQLPMLHMTTAWLPCIWRAAMRFNQYYYRPVVRSQPCLDGPLAFFIEQFAAMKYPTRLTCSSGFFS